MAVPPVFPLPGAVGPGGAQDDAASTASNLANFQDDGDEVDDDDVEDGDGDDSGSGVGPEGEGVLADQVWSHSQFQTFFSVGEFSGVPASDSYVSVSPSEGLFLGCRYTAGSWCHFAKREAWNLHTILHIRTVINGIPAQKS